MRINVSNGEIIDKISILEIKKNKIKNETKLKNIDIELQDLYSSLDDYLISLNKNYFDKLYKVNLDLWEVEDRLRIKESTEEFDSEFIELARKVYRLNDERAIIKKEINVMSGSIIVEEKEYVNY